MGRHQEFNRNRLHALFYSRSDRRKVLAMNQRMYATEIGITPWHLNRIIQGFVSEGRLRRLSPENRRLQTYIVNDPIEFLRAHHDTAGITDVENALEVFKGVPRVGRGKVIQDQIRARREAEVEEYQKYLREHEEQDATDATGPDSDRGPGPDGILGEPGPSA